MTQRGYNERKRLALQIFAERGQLYPTEFAAIAGIFPVRACHSYLLRLHRFGLLDRRKDRRGLLTYSLSPRGRRRLAWLRT
jgi:hypothetical protein